MQTLTAPDIAKKQDVNWPKVWLYGGMGVVGVLILVLTVINFTPLLRGSEASPDKINVEIPAYDVTAWKALPCQDNGRYKPFETACRETMRRVAGRERLKGTDATSIVLMWMLEQDPMAKGGLKPEASQWDGEPFILCEHNELRKLIYRLEDNGQLLAENKLTSAQVHDKYISPKDLREFRSRLRKVRKDNVDAYKELTRDIENPLDEAIGRLAIYESIRGYAKPGDDMPMMPGAKPEREKPSDPFGFVALDQVPGSPWFSMADLRMIVGDTGAWHELFMTERVKKAPQLYVSPEHVAALTAFQEAVKAGKGDAAISDLTGDLQKQREATVKKYEQLRADKKDADADQVIDRVLGTVLALGEPGKKGGMPENIRQAAADLMKAARDGKAGTEDIAQKLATVLNLRDAHIVAGLREQLPTAKDHYHPDDPKYRMLHLTYMELRYPNIYKEASTWQPVPTEKARKVLAAWADVGIAYRSGDADRFESASQKFFEVVESESTPPYPGEDSVSDRVGAVLTGAPLNPPDRGMLALEQTFNKVAPFQKAWVLMLFSLFCFCMSLGLDSKKWYLAAWALFAGSLAFQLFGFFVRVTISGRPPVTNMYETVIWVAFMSAVFGAILELIYRKKVFAVAAAMVATIGLVLADQLPLALDPKINPLVPVLRSNFWLTIHVLTIVSSYAGGTLAWGLGNIALFLIVFGKGKGETIKVLSQFTYRALQIAVLLLAAGTFLGGWWAAYSWGRFWGWDPKETGALIALVCYVIPLHMRYIGWIRDFGLAVAAILCYAAILMSWYGINFWIPAGLHSYGFGGGGVGWVFWACLINIEWVLAATLIYRNKLLLAAEKHLRPEMAGGPAPDLEPEAKEPSEHVRA